MHLDGAFRRIVQYLNIRSLLSGVNCSGVNYRGENCQWGELFGVNYRGLLFGSELTRGELYGCELTCQYLL